MTETNKLPEHLKKYLVAVKSSKSWKATGEKSIPQLRAEFNRGVITLCQHRIDENSFALLAIPLGTPAKLYPHMLFGYNPAKVENEKRSARRRRMK